MDRRSLLKAFVAGMFLGVGCANKPRKSGSGGGGGVINITVPPGTSVLIITRQTAAVQAQQFSNGLLVDGLNGNIAAYHYRVNGVLVQLAADDHEPPLGIHQIAWQQVDPVTDQVLANSLVINCTVTV